MAPYKQLQPSILGFMPYHPHAAYEDAKVLIMAKTYPNHSHEYDELVCTAGLRIDTQPFSFIRLYPIPFRKLSREAQYEKWQIVNVRIRKRDNDHRPESYEAELSTIHPTEEVVSSRDGWRRRCSYLSSFFGQTDACSLLAGARNEGTASQSLALIKPKEIVGADLQINPEYAKSGGTRSDRVQVQTLFGPEFHEVCPAPIILKYTYKCQKHGCHNHTQSVIDWEMQATAHKTYQMAGPDETKKVIREKFVDHFHNRDLWFFVGNMHKHPANFLILSFFYPGLDQVENSQPMLFA